MTDDDANKTLNNTGQNSGYLKRNFNKDNIKSQRGILKGKIDMTDKKENTIPIVPNLVPNKNITNGHTIDPL